MKIRLRGVVVVIAASLALGLGACGHAGESPDSGKKKGLRIGLLLPENQTTRYEQFDRPLIEKKIKELCDTCTVEYANAQNDVSMQRQQIDSMIVKGVDALILDAVDVRGARASVVEAKRAGIPVVAYDRDTEGPISAYVSHESKVGRLQGEALVKAWDGMRGGGQLVRVGGPSTSSRETTPFTQGAQAVLKGKVKVSKMYRATGWNAGSAYTAMSSAIANVGAGNIVGVWVINDALADGVISALKDARIKPLPPVVAQDADLAAVQRIVRGEQYMTVYKPYKPEADTAARMAIALGRGQKLDGIAKSRINTPTTKGIPAVLISITPVTAHNVKDTVVKDGMYTIDQICTAEYRPACDKVGLTG